MVVCIPELSFFLLLYMTLQVLLFNGFQMNPCFEHILVIPFFFVVNYLVERRKSVWLGI